MTGQAVLIYMPDADAEQRLVGALGDAGMDVYVAESTDAVLQALSATTIPVVIIDADALTARASELADRIHATREHTAVVFSGRNCTAGDALDMLRADVADFLPRPIDSAFAVSRITAAIARRARRLESVALWEHRARALEQDLDRAQSGSGARVAAMSSVDAFAEYALETFLAIERHNVELTRKLQELEDPGSIPPQRPLTAWVAHSDVDFATGVASVGPKLSLTFASVMTTGGEVLDRMSSEQPDILVVDAALPDIPAELLMNSVGSDHPNLQMVLVDGWGTENREVVVSGGHAPDFRREMNALPDLLAALEEAAARARATVMAHDFASEFRQRHEEFLRRFGETKRMVSSIG